jgi:hypothetical protein
MTTRNHDSVEAPTKANPSGTFLGCVRVRGPLRLVHRATNHDMRCALFPRVVTTRLPLRPLDMLAAYDTAVLAYGLHVRRAVMAARERMVSL